LTDAKGVAQISRMFGAFAVFVRISYLLAALVVLSGVIPYSVLFVQALFQPVLFGRDYGYELWTATILAVMFLLPGRALLRLLRRAELIPDTQLRERPVVASLAAIFSLLGCALVFLVVSVWITTPPDVMNSDIGGPLAFFGMLALMCFAIALLTGELVLVGRLRPATT
jgi:hypothetical protein